MLPPRRVQQHPPRPSIAPRARLHIIGLECDVSLTAQYNPTQLQIDEGVSWTPSATSRDDHPPLEFGSTRPRTFSLELFFDSFEERDRAWQNVQTAYVAQLSRLVRVIDADGDEEQRRPSMVKILWGDGMAPFIGVVESLSTRLTMFRDDGTPVRATCSVKLLEAHRDSMHA